MSLLEGLDLSGSVRLRTSGPADDATCVVTRELVPADLELLGERREPRPSTPIQDLRERHHSLARALASGMTNVQASVLTGYTVHRIHMLTDDPTFAELVLFYRGEVNAEYIGTHEILAQNARLAGLQLLEKMEDTPEDVTDGTRLELLRIGADRTGHGPQSTSTNLNVNVDVAGRMERARQRRLGTKTE